jgi:hypothetical protein
MFLSELLTQQPSTPHHSHKLRVHTGKGFKNTDERCNSNRELSIQQVSSFSGGYEEMSSILADQKRPRI